MRVKEVISILSKLDPDLRVCVNMGQNEMANNLEVRAIHSGDAVHYKGEGRSAHWKPAEYFEFNDEDFCKPEVVVNITSSGGE